MRCGYRQLLLSLVLSSFSRDVESWTTNLFNNKQHRPSSSALALGAGTSSSRWSEKANRPPYLAIITESNACDSEERMQSTLGAIEAAVSTQKVALVSIRIEKPKGDASRLEQIECRVKELTKKIAKLTETNDFHVVVSSDWVGTLDDSPSLSSSSVGVHFKETHRDLIPATREKLGPGALIGTSAHSIDSAVDVISKYGHPDYFFVGTCFLTASHPEKSKADLEGPALPGQVARAIQEQFGTSPSTPVVLAIGGIDDTNCGEPVLTFGADGVAVIRAVLHAVDPADAARRIQASMMGEQ
eukprot:CAMPEP_0119012172 /NCGR_PEP_ID=MMETSP1176-20130426/6129_1 /TAXON_ID=265551 /ORGANISM="Synedropsis recta cf, Strain CCMP1620" /LENGTH=299 /DNA_ID=CAMNT_0006965091 /DNA_START=23 /DNA_END=922 /DNA_ORIENTATION=-